MIKLLFIFFYIILPLIYISYFDVLNVGPQHVAFNILDDLCECCENWELDYGTFPESNCTHEEVEVNVLEHVESRGLRPH